MEHSKKFSAVKNYFDLGVWNETRMRNAVIKNWITEDEFKEIVGKKYEK